MSLLQRCNVLCAQQSPPTNRGPGALPVPPSRSSTIHSSGLRPVQSSASLSSAAVAAAPEPNPPAPIHTTAYLQQTKQLVMPTITSTFSDETEQQVDLSSNALVWALKKVDDQLNQVEQQPNQLHKAVYDFSNGPVGQATSKGVQTAAKFTMTATIEAAKVAAPVGKWALQQGFKAAVGLVGAAMQQEKQQKQRNKSK